MQLQSPYITPYSTLITSYNVHISEYRHNKKPCKDSGKALYSIRIYVLSDSYYHHITPFSVQCHDYMNDIPDIYQHKLNHDIFLHKTPFNDLINLLYESQCSRICSFNFCQMFLFKLHILIRCHFFNFQCHFCNLWNAFDH